MVPPHHTGACLDLRLWPQARGFQRMDRRGRVAPGGRRVRGGCALRHLVVRRERTHLNFVYEMGVGLRMSWLARGVVVVGYRRRHLSNAGLGEVNPGLNSHMLFLGVPIF